MVAADEDALTCDFAETYHIYDWRGLPARRAAVLAFGLKEDSRIRMAMAGNKYSFATLMEAAQTDALAMLVWMQSRDAQHNRNRPKSMVQMLTDTEPEHMAFATAADFEAQRNALLRGA